MITLATTNFVMAGGDNLVISVKPSAVEDTGIIVSDAVLRHLRRFRSVSPVIEGRIKITQ
jgi:hypothetical protein